VEAKFKKTCHVTVTTPYIGVVCHPKASIWYILLLPAYKIWWLSLQPFRRYGMIAGIKTEHGSCHSCDAHRAAFRGGLSSICKDLIHYIVTCVQNLTERISFLAGTWHILHVYKIWPLQIQLFKRYGWCQSKCNRFTWPDHAPFRDDLSSVG